MQSTPNLALPLLLPAQAQKHVTHNEALIALDAVVQLAVLSNALNVPPAEPATGARYLIATGASGSWSHQAGKIALWDGQAWAFFPPEIGWRCFVVSLGRDLVYSAQGWQELPLSTPSLGVNATADATNRFALSSEASLFNHAGAGHQLKLNKAESADTASLLYQKGYSGRAEMGLAGEDRFSLKVSANGSDWTLALTADGTTGKVGLPAGAQIGGLINGAAVVQNAQDQTEGRLLNTGWMGLGRTLGLEVANLNSLLATGFYISTALSTNNAPSNHVYSVLHQQIDGTTAVQIASRPVAGQIFQRHKLAGVWSDWQRILGQSAILGSVSQSSGVPTGALFERGSSANGTFNRYADGSLICLSPVLSLQANIAAGSLFKSANLTWTLPASFIDGAALSINGASGWANGAMTSANAASLVAYSPTSMTTAASFRAMAIGRWY